MTDLPASRLVLVTGAQEFLARRALDRALGGLRAAFGDLTVHRVSGPDVVAGEVAELTSPSLFGDVPALVVTEADDLSEDARDALLAVVTTSRAMADAPDAPFLLVWHPGGTKGKALPDALRAAGAQTVTVAALKNPGDRRDFVLAEARAVGRSLSRDAAELLCETVGSDLRSLASAVAQLCADTSSATIGVAAVARFHSGRAETSGFQVADAALSGQAATAIGLLRSALETGTPHVLLASALANGVRDLIRVRGVSPGSAGAAARQLGWPEWKVTRAIRTATGWDDEGLVAALHAAAAADTAVKTAADSAYALQRSVLAIAAAAPRRRAG